MGDIDEATCFGVPNREYLSRMNLSREALSEGCCPLCGSRLAIDDQSDADIAGLCMEHGRFEVAADQWYHTTPFGLMQEYEAGSMP